MAATIDATDVEAMLLGVAAIMAIAVGVRHRRARHLDQRRDVWPMFWFVLSIVLASLLVARLAHAGSDATQFARDRARSGGWYSERRSTQAAVLAVVGFISLVLIGIALPALLRRGRLYLITFVVVAAVGIFALVRIVSLHQVDVALDHPVAGGAETRTFVVGLLFTALFGCMYAGWVQSRRTRSDLGQTTAAEASAPNSPTVRETSS